MQKILIVGGVHWKKGKYVFQIFSHSIFLILRSFLKICFMYYCLNLNLLFRCTVRGDCQKASHSSPRWLSLGTGQQCIDFEQVLPDRIPINQMTTVHLTIRTLPELPAGANYKCVFGHAEPIDALMTGFGLSCPTPPVTERSNIPEGADHVLVPLSVRSSETNKDFVSRNFAFFDCSRHSVCTECVKSQWACSWCVYDNKCTHNTSCQGIISGENVSILTITIFLTLNIHTDKYLIY